MQSNQHENGSGVEPDVMRRIFDTNPAWLRETLEPGMVLIGDRQTNEGAVLLAVTALGEQYVLGRCLAREAAGAWVESTVAQETTWILHARPWTPVTAQEAENIGMPAPVVADIRAFESWREDGPNRDHIARLERELRRLRANEDLSALTAAYAATGGTSPMGTVERAAAHMRELGQRLIREQSESSNLQRRIGEVEREQVVDDVAKCRKFYEDVSAAIGLGGGASAIRALVQYQVDYDKICAELADARKVHVELRDGLLAALILALEADAEKHRKSILDIANERDACAKVRDETKHALGEAMRALVGLASLLQVEVSEGQPPSLIAAAISGKISVLKDDIEHLRGDASGPPERLVRNMPAVIAGEAEWQRWNEEIDVEKAAKLQADWLASLVRERGKEIDKLLSAHQGAGELYGKLRQQIGKLVGAAEDESDASIQVRLSRKLNRLGAAEAFVVDLQRLLALPKEWSWGGYLSAKHGPTGHQITGDSFGELLTAIVNFECATVAAGG